MDPKTSLQEAAAAIGGPAPTYAISSSGPDHSRVFVARVSVGTVVSAEGTGSSKKHAEMAAASPRGQSSMPVRPVPALPPDARAS